MNQARWFRWIGLPLAIVLLVLVAFRCVAQLTTVTPNHITGIWVSLSQYLDQGWFYPPLESNGCYAGTRYMPVVFVTTSLIAPLTKSYLLAAKLTAVLWSLALLALVFISVRRIVGNRCEAFIMTIALLAMPEVREAIMAPHQEAPSITLTLAGLIIVSRSITRRHILLASLLFAAAFLTKWSALAGVAGAFLYLIVRHRKEALWLACGTGVFIAIGLVFIQWTSGGRFLENFQALGSGGMTGDSILNAPHRMVYALTQDALSRSALFISALLNVMWRVSQRDVGLMDCYFVMSMASLQVILASPGTERNHMLEPEVASLLIVAGMARLVALRIVLLIVIGIGISVVISKNPADGIPMSESDVRRCFRDDSNVLSEDASVPILLGQRPVVMDAFAYRLMAEKGIVDPKVLAERIKNHEFDAIVFRFHPERPGALCPRFHFGPLVTDAILRYYHDTSDVGPWSVYTPKP